VIVCELVRGPSFVGWCDLCMCVCAYDSEGDDEPASSKHQKTPSHRVKELKECLQEGLIGQDEFDERKKNILDSI